MPNERVRLPPGVQRAALREHEIAEGLPSDAQHVLDRLSNIKLEVCHAALDEQGYGEDIDMLIEGDDEEVDVMIAAVEGIKDVKLPVIKKFKRELGKLRAA